MEEYFSVLVCIKSFSEMRAPGFYRALACNWSGGQGSMECRGAGGSCAPAAKFCLFAPLFSLRPGYANALWPAAVCIEHHRLSAFRWTQFAGEFRRQDSKPAPAVTPLAMRFALIYQAKHRLSGVGRFGLNHNLSNYGPLSSRIGHRS